MLNTLDLDLKTALITAVTTIVSMPLLLMSLKIVARHATKWVDTAIDGVFYWLSRYILHGIASRMSLKAYCRLLLSSTRFVPVPSARDINLEIDSIFVALNLENSGVSQRSVTHATLLTTGNRLRVIGDPGSGKSSLVKRLLRDAAQEALSKPSSARLPVLLELRDFSVPEEIGVQQSGEYLYNKLRAQVDEMNVYRMGECFDAYSSSSGLLVLLDGLDEIASTEYSRAQVAITGLSETLDSKGSNNIVVLTSRTQFHQQVREAYVRAFPSVYFLKPFSPTDIYEFLTRWPFGADHRSNVNRIYQDLTDRPTLRELCGNPLILSMYVAEAEGTVEHIVPDSRTEFYSRVADELLVNRRVRQTRQQAGRTAMRDLREQILGAVAFDHLLDRTQPANSLNWPDAVRRLADRLNISIDAAEIEFNELSRETGLFTIERPRETFRFIHLTLCEFFAAAEAVKNRRGGWADLIAAQKRYEESTVPTDTQRLVEVIPFACGLLHRVDRHGAIADVAQLENNRLLARCLLETKLYEHPAWMQFTAEAYTSLVTINTVIGDEWLFDFHLFNMVTRDAKIATAQTGVRVDTPDIDQVLQSVVTDQSTGLARIIDAYAEKDAAAVFRVADLAGIDLVREYPVTVIHNLDQRPFMELLIDRVSTSGDDAPRWAAVFAEAGLRSRPVAQELHARPPIAGWDKYIDAVPKSRCWNSRGIMIRSLYSDALTIASSTVIQFPGALLPEFHKIPPPSTYRRFVGPNFLLMGAVFFALPLYCLSVFTPYSLFSTAAAVVMLFLYIALLRSIVLRGTYRSATGLIEESQDLDAFLLGLRRALRFLLPPKLRRGSESYLRVRATSADGESRP